MQTIDTLATDIGEEPIRSMVAAFYRRVHQDPLIGPMYPQDDWAGAENRLAGFLIYRFGGSAAYLESRGHPRLRARHAPFSIGTAERDRWLELMNDAMQETGISDDAAAVMRPFFAQVADMMRNRTEDDDH